MGGGGGGCGNMSRSNSTSSITFQIPYMGSFTDLGLQGRQYFIYIRQDLI